MKKTKILIMINSMGVGGAEKSLSSMLSLFNYDKYEVYLQLINRGGVFEKLLPKEVQILPRLPYYEFCSMPLKKQVLSGNFKFLWTRVKVRNQLQKNGKAGKPLHPTQAFWAGAKDAFSELPAEYDVAIAWGQGTPTHFVAEKVKAKKKVAWINADYEAVGHNKNFDRATYGRYDKIACVSNLLTEKMKNVYPEYCERFVTIYDINSAKLINKLALEDGEFNNYHGVVISSVGRLVEPKGYDMAVETARILKEKGFDFTWTVCGDGVLRRQIECCITQYGLEKDFVLLGARANPYPYMKAADIYVQTSRFEGYCLTLTEARILNRPCVATRFDVVYDQMVDGENGLVVDMTPHAIAEGIIRLIQDKALYEHIQSYQQAEKKGNEEEIEQIYELIEP